MSRPTSVIHDNSVTFPFHTCRNISGPDDEEAGRKILSGHAPADSFLQLEDNENVREYLVDAVGKQKASPTLVHRAMRKTLKEYPERFSVLNGGICLVARGVTIDDKAKIMQLLRPSIINGSQTRGELMRYVSQFADRPTGCPSVTYEIIVTDDDDLIAEISIARNFQNDVRAISIAGRRGQLDELENALQARIPDVRLRKSETDLSDEYLDTERLIQVLFAVVPDDLSIQFEPQQSFASKAFTYSQKTKCLKLFQRTVENRQDVPYAQLYEFLLQIAPDAWKLYEKWKAHPGFRGTRLHRIERTPKGEIADVPDGIIFPIIAAHSAFMRRSKGKWVLAVPQKFDDNELIEAAVSMYQDIAKSNPQTMGKSRACYSNLHRIASIYARVS